MVYRIIRGKIEIGCDTRSRIINDDILLFFRGMIGFIAHLIDKMNRKDSL